MYLYTHSLKHIYTHTQMEEHEKALTLLAHKLKDHPMAQDYCERNSEGQGRVYRQNLYQTLLRVYLQPHDRCEGNMHYSDETSVNVREGET